MATRTVAADGSGDYLTLLAWYLALPSPLTEPEICQIKGTITDTIAFTKTTTAANYVEFRAFPGTKHTGTPGTGARWQAPADNRCLESGGKHFVFRDLELSSDHTLAPINMDAAVTGATLTISGCIYQATGLSGTSVALPIKAAAMTAVVENSVIISSARGMDSRNISSLTMRNCTFWSTTNSLGVIAGTTSTITNCYAGKATGTQQDWSNAATPAGSYNASSDTTATALFSTGSINSVAGADAFENPATSDFRLKTGSVLIDAGVTISGFTTDIIGTTRPQGSGYDIGAFEHESGASSTPVAFSGSVPNQTGTEGTAFSLDLSTYFSGSETPFAYSVQSGTLPAVLSLNTSTGVISGTPTTAGVSSGIVIRATDATPDTADTNAFSITINAAGDVEPPALTGSVTFTSITQTSYTAQWPAGSDNVAVTGYEYQIGSTAGAWADAGNSLSAAITGRTAGTTETVYVRAYDAAGLRSTPAISGEVTLESIPASGINVTEPLKNNAGTVLASQSGVRVAVLQAADLVSVHEATGLTTNASGILATISDAAITAGQQYHVAIKLADGSVGITGPITAS